MTSEEVRSGVAIGAKCVRGVNVFITSPHLILIRQSRQTGFRPVPFCCWQLGPQRRFAGQQEQPGREVVQAVAECRPVAAVECRLAVAAAGC